LVCFYRERFWRNRFRKKNDEKKTGKKDAVLANMPKEREIKSNYWQNVAARRIC